MGLVEDNKCVWKVRNKQSSGKHGDSQLHQAARDNNLTQVREILSALNASGLRELIWAHNKEGETALYVAAENGLMEILCEILKFSDVQSAALKAHNSFDPFHIAAKYGHIDVLKELLNFSLELVLTTNSLNATALDTAATQGHTDVVDLLLAIDASLAKIARKNGKTPLHSAARAGHGEVVRSLLRKDPSILLRTDKKGQTALHMAVKGKNVGVVQELLKYNPSIITFRDNKGNTPLHTATRKGRPQIIQSLLSVEGVDVNAINRAGETVFGIAEKSFNQEVTTVLREAGAMPAKRPENPPRTVNQLKQTVSYLKHEVQSQLRRSRQTEMQVQGLKKKLKKIKVGGLSNVISSNIVVATLIASIAFAAIFSLPGQYADADGGNYSLGQAYIAKGAAFIVFIVCDSLALFISLAVVVVQTSLIVIDRKAMEMMVVVINKLMWLCCIFISISFVSLSFIVVSRQDWWLAWSTVVIAASIMLSTLAFLCYCIVLHRMERKSLRNSLRGSRSQSYSRCSSLVLEDEVLELEYKTMYAL